MQVTARVSNTESNHLVIVKTDARAHPVQIAPKPTGRGSGVSGGELLFLALATWYCNDIFREANKRGIVVQGVEVQVQGEFGAEGEPARDISYSAMVRAQAGKDEIRRLMVDTDRAAEVQNT
ncbi:MAG: OsmC family protein, partial [Rudaea sp.]